MRGLFWALFLVLTTGTALLAAVDFWPLNPSALVTLGIIYALHPLGALWMTYQCVRYEREPLRLVLLALIPYSFVWYYFERVKKGKQTRVEHP